MLKKDRDIKGRATASEVAICPQQKQLQLASTEFIFVFVIVIVIVIEIIFLLQKKPQCGLRRWSGDGKRKKQVRIDH